MKAITFIKEINEKYILFFLVSSILLYPFIFIWQCGDLTDTGFFAVNYQNFFYNLNLGKTNSISFFADLVGALWFNIFPNFGIIGLKFLYLIFFYSIILITYLILKNLTKNTILLLFGIFCGVVFSERAFMFVFSRDIASWFFLIFSIYLFSKAKNSVSFSIYFFSGTLYTLACLSRFPNIVFIAILPFLLIFNELYFKKNERFRVSKIVKPYIAFTLGFVVALIFFAIILHYNDYLYTFIDNLDVVKNSDRSSHSIIPILKFYIIDLYYFLPHAIIIASLMLTLSLISEYTKISMKNLPLTLLVVFIFSLAFLYYTNSLSYGNNIKYFVPSFCFLPLLYSIIQKDKYAYIVLMITIISFIQVAGTNTGLLLKMNYGFIILIPISIIILHKNKQIRFLNIIFNAKPILSIGIVIILLFSFIARIGSIYHVETGLFVRLNATYTIENNYMKYIYTTKQRANHINSICTSIKRYKQENNTLFIYGHQPMFYYLTESSPPINKFWLTGNEVQVIELFNYINESISSTGKYPLIVDTKEYVLGMDGEEKLNEFLKQNKYSIYEKNDTYIIWNRNTNN